MESYIDFKTSATPRGEVFMQNNPLEKDKYKKMLSFLGPK
jgi:hypothetical protein